MATPPVFVSGAVLLADQMNDIGLWLVKSQTIGTAVSSVTVTDAFSADFDSYKIIVSGGVASGNNDINLRLGAAATGYFNGYSRVTYSTGAAATVADNNASSFVRVGFGTSDTLFFHADLINPFATKRTIINGFVVEAGAAFLAGAYAGFIDNATSFTAFTLLADGGINMTGGTIRVYGYRN